jgi:hypothetical protein
MSKELGSFKKGRSAADASMLVELRKRAIQSSEYNNYRTQSFKPVYGVSPLNVLIGNAANYGIARVVGSGQIPPPGPTYQITASTSSVDEGAAVLFTITTTNVANGTTLYWSNIGTTTAADFVDSVNSGSVTINANGATITRTLLLDSVASENETVILQLRTESLSGPVVATSGTVTVVDRTKVYAITESVTNVNEGSSVTFTVTTTNVADGTVLYWTNSGTTTGADFTDGQNNGSVTVTGGTGTITRTLLLDDVISENETVILQLRTDSVSGTIVATSGMVTVIEKTAIYVIAESASIVDEGASVTFTVTTTNVADGTTLYWTNSGTTTGADFLDGQNNGSFTINSNSATITRTLLLDAIASESETVILQIRTGSVSGTVVATSGTVTVVDRTAVYAVAESTSSIDEGQFVTFTVTTTNVDDGTILYWTTSGTATGSEFTDGQTSGSFTITSNSGTITRTAVTDAILEGNQTFTLSVRTDSISGTVVATSGTVTIVDKSPSYSIVPTTSTITEGGQSVTFNITTTNVANGTTLYWENIGTTNASDFTQNALGGTVTINSNSASVLFTTIPDLVTEGTETLIVILRIDSGSGPIVATSSTVSITDSSNNALTVNYDFNTYTAASATIANQVVGSPIGDGTILNTSRVTYNTATPTNKYVFFDVPNNTLDPCGALKTPSITVRAMEIWVRYPAKTSSSVTQYVFDARPGSANNFWITYGVGTTDTIGSANVGATVYFNTVAYTFTSTTPSFSSTVGALGWFQIVINFIGDITDDIVVGSNGNNQGIEIDLAQVCFYNRQLTAAEVKRIFNSKCSRYGLSPIA